LKLDRRKKTDPQTQGKKKKNGAKDRKKTIIFSELQYPISQTKGKKRMWERNKKNQEKEEKKEVPHGHCKRMFSLIVAILPGT